VPSIVGGARTPQPIRRAFDVASHGAIGDGVADDTAAIQRAIDAATGGPAIGSPTVARRALGVVYLPPGIYRITRPLKVYSVAGFVLAGSGIRSSIIQLDGIVTTGLDLAGCKDSIFREFSLTARGGYQATFVAKSMMSLNYTPTTTAMSSAGNLFENLRVFDARFHTGIDIGGASATFDVSAVSLSNVLVVGARYDVADAGETEWQRAVSLGSGVAGNILDHYLDGVRFANVRHGLYVDAVNNVSCRDFAASACSEVFWKRGPGALTIDTGRAESSTRLVGSTGGASYPSHLKISSVVWAPGPAAVAGGHVIQWGYPGTVLVENFVNQYLAGVQGIHVAAPSPRQVNIVVNGWSAGHDWDSLVSAAGATPATLTLNGWTRQAANGSVVSSAGPLVKGYNVTVNTETFFR